jgi:hypothetical protein
VSGWMSAGVESEVDLEWKCRWKTLKRGEFDRGGGEEGIVDDLGDDDEVRSGAAIRKVECNANKTIQKGGTKVR